MFSSVEDVGFCGGRQPEKPEQRTQKENWEQGENQQQAQPTYGTGPELNQRHIGGRRALSPHPPCSPKREKEKSRAEGGGGEREIEVERRRQLAPRSLASHLQYMCNIFEEENNLF